MINKDINKELVNKVVQTILDWDIKESKKDNRFNFFASFYGYPILDLDEKRVKKDLEDKNLYEKKVSFRKGILP